LEAEKRRKDLSKGDALYVERKRVFFTYSIKTFRDEEGEATFLLSKTWFIINDEEAYKGMY
jgi:hypothetical protein